MTGRRTIGDIAKLCGVGVETIRFYEREGIINQPKKGIGTFRFYPDEVIHRVRFVKRAQELGFSLNEVIDLLSLRANEVGSCATVKKKSEQKIFQIKQKIRDLRRIQLALEKVKNNCSQQGPDDKCPVLEILHVYD